MHASGDGEEILAIERIALEDEGVKAELAKLQLPEGSVVISDPWIYGMCASLLRDACLGKAHLEKQAPTVSTTTTGCTNASFT